MRAPSPDALLYEWGYDVSSFGGSQRRHGITQGKFQSLLGHLAERVDSRNRFIRARSNTKSLNLLKFDFFLLSLAFREKLIFGFADKLLFE